MNAPLKQHLIDPEICIRCGTCEETCPIDAVTHNDDNYVVDAEICNYCMDCIAPCPTGSIDNWRIVTAAYSLDEQYEWEELPEQEELANDDGSAASLEALEDEIDALLAKAHEGTGGKAVVPASASKPTVNLFRRDHAAVATVQGTFRLTKDNVENDVRHIILDFGDTVFPVLEGQSIAVTPPGTDDNGKPHDSRLYSIASPRDGERPNTNNIALTVKREPRGLCSNYLCDLKKGDRVEVTGPFGSTFLMPNDPLANIIMICTGTGSAPFRGFTERRRRAMPDAPGGMHAVSSAPAATGGTCRISGLCRKRCRRKSCCTPNSGLFTGAKVQRKEYVQDRIRNCADEVSGLLKDERTHIYICGLKGMETGVDEALADICRAEGLDWADLKPVLRTTGRYHVETY